MVQVSGLDSSVQSVVLSISVHSIGIASEGEGETEALGEIEPDGEIDADTDADGEIDADGLML